MLKSKKLSILVFSTSGHTVQWPPSHSPDATILIYLNDREGASLSFVGFCPPHPPQTPQYLTILGAERGRHYVCRILASPMPPPPPSNDATILSYPNGRERGGAIIFCRILAPPNAPPSQTPQYT